LGQRNPPRIDLSTRRSNVRKIYRIKAVVLIVKVSVGVRLGFTRKYDKTAALKVLASCGAIEVRRLAIARRVAHSMACLVWHVMAVTLMRG
jgi:hypothetical protein